MKNIFLTCVLLPNEAETQKLCRVQPFFLFLFVYQYMDDIRNALDQGATVIFLENLFPEVRKVHIF